MPDSRPPTSLNRLLRRLGVDVRPSEVAVCCLLFAMHFLLLAFQYTSKAVRQASFIDTFGSEQLPFVYLGIAVISYPVLLAYGWCADRFQLNRLLAGLAFGVSLSLVLFWWLFGLEATWVSAAFYVWVSIIGILLVSQFWSYSSQRLDARQAKRLFGFIGAGGLLGSIAGGQITSWVGSLVSTRAALIAAAFVLAVFAILVVLKADCPQAPTLRRTSERLTNARAGFGIVRRSKYLKLIAGIMLLASMVAQVIDIQFSWAVEQSTDSLAERTAAFGNLFSIMGFAAFIFQMLFTARIHRRLGIGFALRVLPVTNGLGTFLFLLAAVTVSPTLLPFAWMLKIGENGLRYSLDQATRELLFQPVPAEDRPLAKAFIDVFVQRLAKGLAAVALLTISFGWLSVIHASWLSLGWIVLWLFLISATQSRYVRSFRDALLNRGLQAEAAIDIRDVETLEVLMEGLSSSDSREVLHSMELLAAHGRGRLITPMMLHHPDPAVRARTLLILKEADRRDTAPMVEKLLVDPDPTVRATASLALVALTPRDIRDTMMEHLRDPDPRVRGVSVSYLARQDDAEATARAEEALQEMLSANDPIARQEAARALGTFEDPVHFAGLVKLLYDKDPNVVRRAIEAVMRRVQSGSTNPIYAPILISLLHSRRLKHDARNALVAYGTVVIPQMQHFLNEVQEEPWVRRALPKTIAQIGGKKAYEALIESLEVAKDPFLRGKIVEALGRVRAADPRLAPDRAAIEDQLAYESHAFLRILTDLWSLVPNRFRLVGPHVVWPEPHKEHLLVRLLADRMDDHVQNIFGLVALLHTPRDIRAAHRGLISDSAPQRANALEFLENTLSGEVRRLVFAVIDDSQLAERLREAKRIFELTPASPVETLRRLAAPPPTGDDDGAWLTATALHYICDDGYSELYPMIYKAADRDPGQLIRETTQLLTAHLDEAETLELRRSKIASLRVSQN